MSIRILVVDDNLDALRTYVKALQLRVKPKGWERPLSGELVEPLIEVEDADTVSLALQKLETQLFEILVVDLKIPGSSGDEMGGNEIISESIMLDPLRPIIVITGYGTVDRVKKALSQGVFDFIEKSLTAADDLVNAVQQAIDYRDEKIM
jgi:DNA-binding NtrC family response regulator